MVVVALAVMVAPAETLGRFGFEPGGPVTSFLAWAYLGMAIASSTAVRGGPSTLLAPALAWITFFLGATAIHLHSGHGAGGHGGLLYILATHLLISVLLGAGLLAGGSREPVRAEDRRS